MSAATPPPDDRRPGGPESPIPARPILTVMAVVLTAALLVFVYGFESLIFDRDVITQADAGTLTGPLMFVAVLAVVARAVGAPRAQSIRTRAIGAGVAAVLIGPAVGAIVYSLVRTQIAVIPVFFANYVVSPFVLSSGVVAGLVVLVAGHLDARR
ncbi:DUF6121 family protein [Marisediminicola sp. LYQ134]|uniref:DUF6121 family protein n=1 Tax=unclassified Marisediminicola TaxID=2618316 RepID=UPI003982F478